MSHTQPSISPTKLNISRWLKEDMYDIQAVYRGFRQTKAFCGIKNGWHVAGKK